MGARRISNATNEKIIALISIGMKQEQVALTTGRSASYCSKLWNVVKYIGNAQWDELIEYSKSATTGGVIAWACEYLDTPLPQDVTDRLNALKYRTGQTKAPSEPEAPEAAAIDNTAAAIIKLLEKLDEAVNAITEAADDVCQTVATARKLNEDNMNANFDVLTATMRDGIESIKTTIRKGQK